MAAPKLVERVPDEEVVVLRASKSAAAFFFLCVCLLITHLWSWEIPQGRREVRVDEQSIGFICSAVEEKHAQQDQWHVQA